MSTSPNSRTPTDPRIDAEWQRQERARSEGSADPLYRAMARAAADAPAPMLPADFMQTLERRAQRSSAEDRFELGLLSLVLCAGGLLAAFYGLPVLAELTQGLNLTLPALPEASASWALLGAAGHGWNRAGCGAERAG
ncbi:hypothetical protein [Aquimonas sp.]|jgi:hypothetical protein|uniref:hypothetical protein n=1 Tax=Aquimonas sp. TaxID=1872588 RepID=UPI0037BF8D6C